MLFRQTNNLSIQKLTVALEEFGKFGELGDKQNVKVKAACKGNK